jgi:hypothetical protein
MKTKEEVILKMENKIIFPLSVLLIISILVFFASPSIWIWCSFYLALKVFLTSFLLAINLIIIIAFISSLIKFAVKKFNFKSEFQDKLDELQKTMLEKKN